MRLFLFISLFLFSCAPDIATLSGVGVYCDEACPESWTRSSVDATILAAVKAFESVDSTDFKGPQVIGFLRVVKIVVRPSPSFFLGGRKVSGFADCYYGTAVVGSDPPAAGALVHELAHLLERCDAKGPPNDCATDGRPVAVDADHAGWCAKGIYAAVDAAREAAVE